MDDEVLNSLPDFLETDDLEEGFEVAEDNALELEVKKLFVLLLKTLRSSALYVEGNPLLHQFFEDLKAQLQALWAITPSLSFIVSETEIYCNESSVYKEELTAPENLAFQLFKDGIRRFEFFPGIEDEEIRQFLELLRLARTLKGDEDDLLTLLWNQDFSFLRYEYIDVLGDEPPVKNADLSADADEELPLLPSLELAPELQTPQVREDFEPSLYFLDEAEVANLQQELQREWGRTIKKDVMLAVLDQFEMGDMDRRYEIMGILRQMLPRILAEGDFYHAAKIVNELGTIADKTSDPEVGDHVDQIVGELSEPVVLEQLVRLLEDGMITADSEELATLLDALKPTAIVILMESAPLIARPEARKLMTETLDRLAALNPASIQGLLDSDDARVAAEAARIVGRLKLVESADAIAKLLERPAGEVRVAAVESLVQLRTSRAGKPLLKALTDSQREVRLAAAKGLTELRFKPGFAELEACIQNKEVWRRDVTEQLALFEAYAAAGGQDCIRLLNRMLNGRRTWWSRYPGQIRACAARALGVVGGDDAIRVLAAGSKDKDPIVRSAVSAAQRGPTSEEKSDADA